MRSLLRSRPVVGVDAVLALLSDHEGAPTAICRHPARDIDDMETLGAAVVVPAERALYLTAGPPCRSEVQRFAVAGDEVTAA